jgi:hypothetical protein
MTSETAEHTEAFHANGIASPPSVEELLAEEHRRRARRRIGPGIKAAILLITFVLGLGSGYLLWGNTPESQAQRLEKDRAALAKQVNPEAGFELPMSYGNVGPQLISAGAIDEAQFVKLYQDKGKPLTEKQLNILRTKVDGRIRIDKSNSDSC